MLCGTGPAAAPAAAKGAKGAAGAAGAGTAAATAGLGSTLATQIALPMAMNTLVGGMMGGKDGALQGLLGGALTGVTQSVMGGMLTPQQQPKAPTSIGTPNLDALSSPLPQHVPSIPPAQLSPKMSITEPIEPPSQGAGVQTEAIPTVGSNQPPQEDVMDKYFRKMMEMQSQQNRQNLQSGTISKIGGGLAGGLAQYFNTKAQGNEMGNAGTYTPDPNARARNLQTARMRTQRRQLIMQAQNPRIR